MNYRAAIYLLLIFLYQGDFVCAQVVPDSNAFIQSASVQWLKQYPPRGKHFMKRKKGLKDFIYLLAGGNDFQQKELVKPIAIIAIDSNNLFLADQDNGILFRIKNGRTDIPKAFNKQKIFFPSIVGACTLPDDRILFTDSRLNKIICISKDKRSIKSLNDSLTLAQPTGIAYSSTQQQVWVVETIAHRIAVLDESGNRIKTIGKRGSGKGEFNFPTSIWIDGKGLVYVVDALNYRVQLFDEQGNYLNSFGSEGSASGYFARPKGIATDSYGNIYVADALFHVVQIFDRQGRFLLSFGSQGREDGQFWMPTGIYIDKSDVIYVADTYNARVQLFKLDQVITNKTHE